MKTSGESGAPCVEGERANRLADEKSPYLLQHACNPVDWFPWDTEAFERARKENKPIFLSIGYSTCHWCHVMERESFENEEIAAILNEHFVSIKVDREERPNIDRVYMAFVQASTAGSGGWPMSVFLDSELKPFFGGTYFPPDSRYGRPGFRELLLRIAGAWKNERENLIKMGNSNIEALRRHMGEAGESGKLSAALLDTGFSYYQKAYDAKLGGFGGAPKFPRPVNLNFLFRYHARSGDKAALEMTLHTLREMARGGMYDHLGGGFHRYSVDEYWHVPHFEKMLYDQGQLVVSYLEAYQITHDEFYAEVACQVLDYVLRDMRGPDGGFYSAEDADSAADPAHPKEKTEGAFYIWTLKEIEKVLGQKEHAEIFSYYYGVKNGGNVLSDPHGEFHEKSILYVAHTVGETAHHFKISEDEARQKLAAAREKLFKVRGTRPRPHLDDKILTAWNGLMISGFARAAQVLPAQMVNNERYLEAARRAADLVMVKLYDESTGRLRRRYRAGEAAFQAAAEDYAFFIQGLLDLYEASFEVRYLQIAARLQEKQVELFWDAKGGGFFNNTGEDASVLLRLKEDYDGAEPAASSVSVLNLLRLSQIRQQDDWRQRAEQALRAFSPRLQFAPQALPQMLVALDLHLAKKQQIIIAGEPGAADTRALLRTVHARFLPHKILLLADGAEGQGKLGKHLEVISTMTPLQGKAAAYVCENFTCKLPTSDPAVMAKLLDGGE